MSLPSVPLPRDEVVVGGEKVLVRGLSRSEVLRIAAFQGDPDKAENFIVSCGVGVSLEEAQAWRDSIPPETASPLVDRICELSGLVEGAQKSG